MGIRCEDCKKSIIHDVKYGDYVSLMGIFEALHLQGTITSDLYESMMNKLTTFGNFVWDEYDEANEALKEKRERIRLEKYDAEVSASLGNKDKT
jgi:hypothetical protein